MNDAILFYGFVSVMSLGFIIYFLIDDHREREERRAGAR